MFGFSEICELQYSLEIILIIIYSNIFSCATGFFKLII